MSPDKLLQLYDAGGINTVGFVIEFLNLLTEANVDDLMQRLPNDVLAEMKRYLQEYRPTARVYNAQPPSPPQVQLARQWATANNDVLIPHVDPEGIEDPERGQFAHLRDETHATKRHEENRPFTDLVAAVHEEIQRIPQPSDYKLYLGSASWLGSDDRARSWLANSDDLTIWKLCYYGQAGRKDKDYAFGVRILYARHFKSLARLSCWQFRFKVPPHYGDHQWFVGFSVRATEESLACIRQVIDTVIAELGSLDSEETNPG